MELNHLQASLEIKQVEQRIISGHAAAWALDRVGDVIDAKAFNKTLREKSPEDVGVFIGHATDDLPVGVCTKLAVDDHGLYCETKVFDGPAGDNLLAVARGLRQHGQSLGLSIGFYTRASKPERVNGKTIRRLTDVDLVEFSYAARQSIANPRALVTSVKAMSAGSDAAGGYLVPTDRKDSGTDGALPCPACSALGNGAFNTPGCSCPNCTAGTGACQCEAAWDTTGEGKTMATPQYRVAQDGNSWTVYADENSDGDADDNRVVGTYDDEETANHVAQALRNEARSIGPNDEEAGEDNAVGPTNAKTVGDSREVKAVMSQKEQDDLPDSSFLYVEHGVKDSEGKTVPRSNRHLPYRTATGALDLPHLRNAIARLGQDATLPGLDDTKKASLQARARKMLEDAGDGKTIDESPEWKTGAPLSIRAVGYQLLDLSDHLAAEFKAMRLLGEETKDGMRIRAQHRARLTQIAADLTELNRVSEMIDLGVDGVARNKRYLAMLELAST